MSGLPPALRQEMTHRQRSMDRISPCISGADLGRVKTSADRKSPLTTCDFQACRFDVFDFSASKSKVLYLRKMSCAFSHGLDPDLTVAVGSRTGAPILGSGGCSTAFAVALSPAAIITFPAPAASNVACDLLSLRSPVRFVPRLMGPMRPRRLSAGRDAIGSR